MKLTTDLVIFRDFRLVFYAYFAFFVPGLVLYLLIQSMPWLVDALSASRSTIWGVFTGLFVHQEFWHFAINMVLLLAYSALFILSNSHLDTGVRKYRSRFFALITFLSATLANLLWIAFVPAKFGTFGASPAVYAAGGLWVGCAVKNTLEPLRSGLRLDYIREALIRNRKLDRLYLFNLMTCLVYVPYIALDSHGFLSVSPGVNSVVHGIAFLIGLSATYLMGHTPAHDQRKVANEIVPRDLNPAHTESRVS